MNNRTYELYDENEYFLKYLSIHPILIYSSNELDKKKKEFQIYLIEKFNNEEINYEQLNTEYNHLLQFEIQEKLNIEQIQAYHKVIQDKLNETYAVKMINLYDLFLIKK
jgi:hypothetical protein